MRRFIIITGPTATGKTRVSVEVAKRLGSEVISADSMQIYRDLDIGTAKATAEEMQGIKHHMIGIAAPDEPYTVADFQRSAFQLIDELNAKGVTPVFAGGTGLYVNALVYDLNFTGVQCDSDFRQKLTQLADDKGVQTLYNMLIERDPRYAAVISPSDRRRIIRRLEILNASGEEAYDFLRPREGIDVYMAGLMLPRDMLYQRIEQRVDNMINAGLVEEARLLYNQYGETGAMKAIGYKELADYFNGNGTFEEVVAKIKQNTRKYAKRQITWFKRDSRIRWFDVSQYPCIEDTVNDIMSDIGRKGF